jgi:hypothetical protein
MTEWEVGQADATIRLSARSQRVMLNLFQYLLATKTYFPSIACGKLQVIDSLTA